MALIDEATLIVGTAKFYTAVVGTEAPLDLAAPGVEWTEIGHTSLDNIMGFESEGGDKNVKGTLQKKKLRTTRGDRTDSFRVDLQQFDEAGLKLFHGSNATVIAGMIQVPIEAIPTTTAFLMVAIDGLNEFGVHAPKSEIYRGDNMEIADTESLASLPLDVTPMQYLDNNWAHQMSTLAAA